MDSTKHHESEWLCDVSSDSYLYTHTWMLKKGPWALKSRNMQLISSMFFIPVIPHIKWRILLVPIDSHVDILLRKKGGEPLEGSFELKIVNSEFQLEYSWGRRNFSDYDSKQDFRITKFMKMESLMEFVGENELKIRCDIRFSKRRMKQQQIYRFDARNERVLHDSVLAQDIQCLYGNERFADMDLFVGPERYRVHKLILAARSQILGDLIEQNCPAYGLCSLIIENVDCDTMKQLLRYMYTTRIRIFSVENAKNLFLVAKKFEMWSVCRACMRFMRSNLTEASLPAILEFAKVQKLGALQERCQKFILINAKEVMAFEP